MRPCDLPLTGIERHFGDDEIIVSKTDLRGRITYANRVFERVSGYTQQELLGKPHSLVRHPDMPRCVFKLLWDTIAAGDEIFAYVLNRAKCGDHYWVLAHVTPSFDGSGRMIGYHSNRRSPSRQAIAAIEPVYRQLLAVESQHDNPKLALAASYPVMQDFLASQKLPYEEFVFTLA